MEYLPPPTPPQLRQLSAALGDRVVYLRRISGGLGATTDVLSLVDTQSNVVLRRHGPWWASEGTDVVAREREALRVARRHGVAAPELVWGEPGGGIFDGPAMVLEYIDGRPLVDPADAADAARQLAEVLVAVHSIDLGDVDANALGTSLQDDVDDISEGMLDHPDGSRLFRAIQAERAGYRLPDPVVVHGDFWPGNTLWSDDRLVGVIDWENAAVGDPAADVAYCMTDLWYLGLDEAAQAFLATYRLASGQALESLRYWTLVALSRPLPDIAQWAPAWEGLGYGEVDVDAIRLVHRRLIDEALDSSN